jgi:hypothetical protein
LPGKLTKIKLIVHFEMKNKNVELLLDKDSFIGVKANVVFETSLSKFADISYE